MNNIKYYNEIESLLKDIFEVDTADWRFYKPLIIEILNENDFTIKRMSAEIEIGVSNGYSLEVQLELAKRLIKQMLITVK